MTLSNLSYCFVCFSICECGHLWNMCFCGLYRLLILPNAWSSSPPLNKICIFSINAISSHSWLYEHCQCCLNGKTENDSTLFMNCYLNFLPLFPFQLLMFLSNISFQPSKPSFELSLQLLNFLLKIFKCKILLYNIQPFFFWIVIFLALFQMFILYVCSCDAHLDFWIFFFFIVVAVVFSFVERTRVFRG